MADELLDTADIFEINKLTAEELLSEEKIKYIFVEQSYKDTLLLKA